MNPETRLNRDHWNAIRRSYESQLWTNTILDSMHFLSDLIRNKTGLLSDGTSLIGQAFGGKSPKLKLNRLETESEKNIQAGTEQLLRGIYQAIRNPRSHEHIDDNQADAESIIIFIDFLIKQIGAARATFSVSQCVNQIIDENFVPSERYSKLIISEIPERHYYAVIIEVFKRRSETDSSKLRHFFNSILPLLSKEDDSEFFNVISNELRESSDESSLRSILQILDESFWPKINEAARLRSEHRLLRNLKDGRYNIKTDKCIGGALATWAKRFYKYFSLKHDFIQAILEKLESSSTESQDYILKYQLNSLDSLSDTPIARLESVIIKYLNKGDQRFFDALTSAYLWRDSSWSEKLITARDNFVPTPPASYDDDIPF